MEQLTLKPGNQREPQFAGQSHYVRHLGNGCTLWTPTPGYLAWLARTWPKLTPDEMRAKGYRMRERKGHH